MGQILNGVSIYLLCFLLSYWTPSQRVFFYLSGLDTKSFLLILSLCRRFIVVRTKLKIVGIYWYAYIFSRINSLWFMNTPFRFIAEYYLSGCSGSWFSPGLYASTDPTRIFCSLSNLDSCLWNGGGFGT